VSDPITANHDNPKHLKCPMCHGRGALRCDCWPGDCICGFDDEPCENCEGEGFFYPDEDAFYD